MRVLVIGGGYIGQNFAQYASSRCVNEDIAFAVDVVDARIGWKNTHFENYDAVLFAAGIAHRKQTRQNKHLYYEVNRDLAIAVAKKAKTAHVRQFVYLSSMSVYGKQQGEITAHTMPCPRDNDYYGHSKFQAEEALKKIAAENFKITVVRPPMVYGLNCPGKFSQLLRLSKFMPIVPDTQNKRSMIYIDNLSDFLYMIIKNEMSGIFCPQNKTYINTAHLIRKIRQKQGKKTATSLVLGAIVHAILPFCPPLKNAFGSLYYVHLPSFANQNIDYLCIADAEEEY